MVLHPAAQTDGKTLVTISKEKEAAGVTVEMMKHTFKLVSQQ